MRNNCSRIVSVKHNLDPLEAQTAPNLSPTAAIAGRHAKYGFTAIRVPRDKVRNTEFLETKVVGLEITLFELVGSFRVFKGLESSGKWIFRYFESIELEFV